MPIESQLVPSTRTRVMFAQSAKGEWRVAEITVELTDVYDPASATSNLFHQVREQAENEVTHLNHPPVLHTRSESES